MSRFRAGYQNSIANHAGVDEKLSSQRGCDGFDLSEIELGDEQRIGGHQYPALRTSQPNARSISSGSIEREATRRACSRGSASGRGRRLGCYRLPGFRGPTARLSWRVRSAATRTWRAGSSPSLATKYMKAFGPG